MELLMCITLVCFDAFGDWRYREVEHNIGPTVYEQDYEMNAITMDSYDRYWAKYNGDNKWRACYLEQDLLSGKTVRIVNAKE